MKKEELEYIPLTCDYMFKKVFMDNPDILKRFLISVLRLDMNPERASIRFLNGDFPKVKKDKYQKVVDILISIDDKRVIDVEINSDRYSLIKDKNTFYIEKIISMGVGSNINYYDMKEYCFYQLNLNQGIGNYFEDKYFTFMDSRSREVLCPNIKVIYKSLDYYRDMYVNNSEVITNDVLWLNLLLCKDFFELERMSKLLMNGMEVQKFMDSVKRECMDKYSIANWENEKMEMLIREKDEEEREGIKREYIKRGIDLVVKNMLLHNYSYDDIQLVTGFSYEEINIINSDLVNN